MAAVAAAVFANADLLDKVVTFLPFDDLALKALRVDRAFCAAAQTRFRLARVFLAPPFSLSPGHVLNSEWLSFTNRGLGDDQMSEFARACGSGALARIKLIFLSDNKIGDQGLIAFSGACAGGALAQLNKLWLEHNQIGDDGLAALADATAKGALSQLTILNLERNQIGDAGVISFAKACANGALAQLKDLFSSDNQIGDDGLGALADAMSKGALPKLTHLRFVNANLAGVEAQEKARNALKNRNETRCVMN